MYALEIYVCSREVHVALCWRSMQWGMFRHDTFIWVMIQLTLLQYTHNSRERGMISDLYICMMKHSNVMWWCPHLSTVKCSVMLSDDIYTKKYTVMCWKSFWQCPTGWEETTIFWVAVESFFLPMWSQECYVKLILVIGLLFPIRHCQFWLPGCFSSMLGTYNCGVCFYCLV